MGLVPWELRSRQQITGNEERRPWAYDDKTSKTIKPGVPVRGNPSVGIGFNLNRIDAPARLKEIGADYVDVRTGMVPLTEKQIDELFEFCWVEAVGGACACCRSFDSQPSQAKIVLVDMAFNMSAGRLRGFHKLLAALDAALVDAAQYRIASHEIMLSQYAAQLPERARQNAALLMLCAPGEVGV